jgi:hypothetical protein
VNVARSPTARPGSAIVELADQFHLVIEVTELEGCRPHPPITDQSGVT